MVIFKDFIINICCKDIVYMDRLKMVFVCEFLFMLYFMDKVVI